ncbi:hypothetical protein IFM89_032072 [Coptis chinensis]|uniref:Uncharacterized protein n=1 Tax=Coptis chinensis TaxID=261450 RepID=A0A835I7H7_9MAGN|nr:hypothetical protein IFM89_032072 [Coptis chinensis]
MFNQSTPSDIVSVFLAFRTARAVRNSLGQVPTGLYNSIFRNNIQQQPQLLLNQHHHPQQQQNLSHGDAQNTGIQELYQSLRSSVNYYPDQSSAATTNLTSMPTSSSSIMEPTVIAGGEFNCWNPQFSWSSVQAATNGTFP